MTATNDRAIIPLLDRLVVTKEQAAELMSVSPRTIERYIAEGALLSIKRGRTRRVVVASLKALIAADTQE